MFARRLPVLVLALGLLAPLGVAEAAPSAQDKAAAKSAWTQGKKLGQQGKNDEAIVLLLEAVDKDPKAQYQLDLARALVKAKKYKDAVGVADAVIASKEANTQKAKQAAAQLKKEVEPKIPTLVVNVTGPGSEGAAVTVDGETITAGKEIKLDPGVYVVKATVGGEEVAEDVDLAESQRRVVALEVGKPKAVVKTDDEKSGGGNMAPAAVLYGIGGAGLAVGAVLGVLAFQKTDEVTELCGGNVCPPEYAGDVALAQDYGTASTVAFAIGGLAVAAGIILTVTVGIDGGPSDEEKNDGKADAAFISPFVGPASAGVYGAF